MKPIREVSREERMERALLVIEGLVLLNEDSFDDPSMKLTELSDLVYRIAHCVSGHCRSIDVKKHIGCSAWFDEIEKLEDALKQLGIMDVEEILSR